MKYYYHQTASFFSSRPSLHPTHTTLINHKPYPRAVLYRQQKYSEGRVNWEIGALNKQNNNIFRNERESPFLAKLLISIIIKPQFPLLTAPYPLIGALLASLLQQYNLFPRLLSEMGGGGKERQNANSAFLSLQIELLLWPGGGGRSTEGGITIIKTLLCSALYPSPSSSINQIYCTLSDVRNMNFMRQLPGSWPPPTTVASSLLSARHLICIYHRHIDLWLGPSLVIVASLPGCVTIQANCPFINTRSRYLHYAGRSSPWEEHWVGGRMKKETETTTTTIFS